MARRFCYFKPQALSQNHSYCFPVWPFSLFTFWSRNIYVYGFSFLIKFQFGLPLVSELAYVEPIDWKFKMIWSFTLLRYKGNSMKRAILIKQYVRGRKRMTWLDVITLWIICFKNLSFAIFHSCFVLQVTSPYGNNLHHRENTTHDQFAFTAHEAGNYLACFWVDGLNQKGGEVSVNLDWKTGIAAKDWESVARKEKIEVRISSFDSVYQLLSFIMERLLSKWKFSFWIRCYTTHIIDGTTVQSSLCSEFLTEC